MEHADFVRAWNEGKLSIDVHRSKALQIANSKLLPKRYRVAHIFWSWVWILTIPVAIALWLHYKWWVGLLILAITPVISRATKKSAAQFIIDYALENPEFFHFAATDGVIKIRQIF